MVIKASLVPHPIQVHEEIALLKNHFIVTFANFCRFSFNIITLNGLVAIHNSQIF